MDRLSMEQGKIADKHGSVVTRFSLYDGEDDDGDRFDDSQI